MGPGSPLRDLGLAGLDLTEAQRDQVRTIMESHREALQQAAAKLREAHRAFAEATFAAAVDEAAIRARSTEVAAAMADEAILRATIRGEVSAILTEEQRQQLESRRAARPRRI
jgi:protein CpxP